MEQMSRRAQPAHWAQRLAVDLPMCRELTKIIIILKGPFEVLSCCHSNGGFHRLVPFLAITKTLFPEFPSELVKFPFLLA